VHKEDRFHHFLLDDNNEHTAVITSNDKKKSRFEARKTKSIIIYIL